MGCKKRPSALFSGIGAVLRLRTKHPAEFEQRARTSYIIKSLLKKCVKIGAKQGAKAAAAVEKTQARRSKAATRQLLD